MKMSFKEFTVSLKLPYIGEVSGKWAPDESEQKAAWEMYVELVTRISVVSLGPDEGLVSEALASLHSLFDITRSILRSYGPNVARPKIEHTYSFGYLAVVVLNGALRPLLAKWHPLLTDWESKKPDDKSAVEWERAWKDKQGKDLNLALRQELSQVQSALVQYANLLAEVADIPSLIIEQVEDAGERER
ncbi:MAG TPA: hypothetical protein VKU00_29570 [Chthonomonadaceae bacterium]|nr:hypothetical protein [Chthonomonadaceae bacterium]